MIGLASLHKLFKHSDDDNRSSEYKALIEYEAKIGGNLFGPLPKGHRREFFCLDERTWVWHEEWTDKNGKHQVVTTRYDVRPDGILKAQGSRYQKLSSDEARNLYRAIELYELRVNAAYDRALHTA